MLTPVDILNARSSSAVRPQRIPESYFGSGDFLKDLKKGVEKGVHSLQKHHILSNAALVADVAGVPGARAAELAARRVGFGASGGGRVSRSALKKRSMHGRGFDDDDDDDDY